MTKQCPACGRYMAYPEKAVCSICEWDRETAARGLVTGIIDTKFFPSLGNVSKARVAELDRRVSIPDPTRPDGYRVGRLMENGKVSDKNPDNLIRD